MEFTDGRSPTRSELGRHCVVFGLASPSPTWRQLTCGIKGTPWEDLRHRISEPTHPPQLTKPELWLHDHPQFLLSPLYIGGDSYSGIIVPTLALAIDESNDSGDKPILNLMGYVAGNPVTDSQFDEDGKIPCLHGMGLISNELYEHAKETCRGKYSAPGNARCEQSIQAIRNCTKDINMLHVLEPLCEEVWSPRIHNTSATDGMSRLMLESARAADDDIIEFNFPWIALDLRKSNLAYLLQKASYVVLKIWANDKTVRESLGVHKGTVGKWTRCNYDIDYIKDVYSTVEYHLTLMREGYRSLIYSGDHDCGIPFTSTQAWIRFLNLSVVDDWRPWYVAGQVAGTTQTLTTHANPTPISIFEDWASKIGEIDEVTIGVSLSLGTSPPTGSEPRTSGATEVLVTTRLQTLLHIMH
uniref:Transposon protein, putative, unclassified n=1 Tax=Oryza sativa subsp. japonica TaxID=39947 RepID=Q2R4V2_ORYSJ|nr:transposon protein, putative, unclassified [Oryza sativa Japonica Group]